MKKQKSNSCQAQPQKTRFDRYLCLGSNRKGLILYAQNEDDAARQYFDKHKQIPEVVKALGQFNPGHPDAMWNRLSGSLVPQKKLLPGWELWWIMGLWMLVVQPLLGSGQGTPTLDIDLSPQSLSENLTLIHLGLFIAGMLHYLRILTEAYVIMGDRHYSNKSPLFFLSAPITLVLAYTPLWLSIDGMNIPYSGLIGGIIGIFLLVTIIVIPLFLFFYPWVFFLRGGVLRLNTHPKFKTALEGFRRSSYALALVHLLSVPAMIMSAEVARQLLLPHFAPMEAIILAHKDSFPQTLMTLQLFWTTLFTGFLKAFFEGFIIVTLLIISFEVFRKRKAAPGKQQPEEQDFQEALKNRKPRIDLPLDKLKEQIRDYQVEELQQTPEVSPIKLISFVSPRILFFLLSLTVNVILLALL
ncbi:hypothetical protein SAMN05920897_106146 [Alkalispirochaeta americana]|uniref:Uncharacterized protein n=1 Tax=Alkalispirochaeta americana TaxID=159291 RepID=A0A1N6RKU0_9SPIO|nr:hypothetical protein [Alkalispirochaeta americana]SIQ29332.1 hypothetical protein SAMN05920897_106146 [Alkalispirochaeta americana]